MPINLSGKFVGFGSWDVLFGEGLALFMHPILPPFSELCEVNYLEFPSRAELISDWASRPRPLSHPPNSQFSTVDCMFGSQAATPDGVPNLFQTAPNS